MSIQKVSLCIFQFVRKSRCKHVSSVTQYIDVFDITAVSSCIIDAVSSFFPTC